MKENYHTHTWRCHHASGTEEAYVVSGIQNGLTVLGFSDHAPHLFAGGYVSGIRMAPEEVPDYYRTIGQLREKYKDQIEIHIGFEMEYYPEDFARTLDMYQQSALTLPDGTQARCEYLILGQHFLNNEYDSPSFEELGPESEERLSRYVDTCIKALETGCFTYLAHPDLPRFTGPDDVYEKHARRLCEAARELRVPLEINLLGLDNGRHYPSQRLFRIARETGNLICMACDAHKPENVGRPDLAAKGEAFAREIGLTIQDHLDLIDPFTKKIIPTGVAAKGGLH